MNQVMFNEFMRWKTFVINQIHQGVLLFLLHYHISILNLSIDALTGSTFLNGKNLAHCNCSFFFNFYPLARGPNSPKTEFLLATAERIKGRPVHPLDGYKSCIFSQTHRKSTPLWLVILWSFQQFC